jgi:hypothetical protein
MTEWEALKKKKSLHIVELMENDDYSQGKKGSL